MSKQLKIAGTFDYMVDIPHENDGDPNTIVLHNMKDGHFDLHDILIKLLGCHSEEDKNIHIGRKITISVDIEDNIYCVCCGCPVILDNYILNKYGAFCRDECVEEYWQNKNEMNAIA